MSPILNGLSPYIPLDPASSVLRGMAIWRMNHLVFDVVPNVATRHAGLSHVAVDGIVAHVFGVLRKIYQRVVDLAHQ